MGMGLFARAALLCGCAIAILPRSKQPVQPWTNAAYEDRAHPGQEDV